MITIIALLAALVGPRIMKSLSKSQRGTTLAQVELLSTALDNYRLDMGRYPSQDEGLQALITKPENASDNWQGPYLRKKKLPKDAWGNPFQYTIPPTQGGMDFDLFSHGADNQPGGEGENAVIGNWQ